MLHNHTGPNVCVQMALQRLRANKLQASAAVKYLTSTVAAVTMVWEHNVSSLHQLALNANYNLACD